MKNKKGSAWICAFCIGVLFALTMTSIENTVVSFIFQIVLSLLLIGIVLLYTRFYKKTDDSKKNILLKHFSVDQIILMISFLFIPFADYQSNLFRKASAFICLGGVGISFLILIFRCISKRISDSRMKRRVLSEKAAIYKFWMIFMWNYFLICPLIAFSFGYFFGDSAELSDLNDEIILFLMIFWLFSPVFGVIFVYLYGNNKSTSKVIVQSASNVDNNAELTKKAEVINTSKEDFNENNTYDNEDTELCCVCGKRHSRNKIYLIDDKFYCKSCVENDKIN